MVTLRSFVPEDAESVRRNLYPDLSLPDIAQMIDEWNTRRYRGKYFEMFAVLSGQEIAGCASLYGQTKSIASAGVEITSGQRGKGIAAEALVLLMQYAAEKGYRIVQDQVRRDNAASIRLHEKLGFESDGYVYRNQRNQEVVLYLKQIGG